MQIEEMSEQHFHRDNHFVPQVYLKPWTSVESGKLWAYRILVSHPKVPLWKAASAKGVAYHTHLYTRIVAGKEVDDFERWFDAEFETPAQGPIAKVLAGERLTPGEWKCLIRFVAAQDVRTPARLAEDLNRWHH